MYCRRGDVELIPSITVLPVDLNVQASSAKAARSLRKKAHSTSDGPTELLLR